MSKRAFKNKHDTDSDTIDQIDQSQLEHSVNNIDVRAIAESKDLDNRVAFSGENKNYGAETKGKIDRLNENFVESKRFAKDIPINEGNYRKNLGNRQK